MDPDLSVGIYPVQGITLVFSEPSNIDSHKSHPQTQTRFVTLESDITKPTSSKIVVSSDMDTYLPSGIDSGWVISRLFREPFHLNSSCHDFEKLIKDEK